MSIFVYICLMTKEQIEKAIAGMDEYVPLRIIERHLQMPKTTLQKVVKGQRELPKKWSKPLEAYFERPKTVVQDLNKQSSGATKKPAENKPKTNYTINSKDPAEGSMAFFMKYGVSNYTELKNKKDE